MSQRVLTQYLIDYYRLCSNVIFHLFLNISILYYSLKKLNLDPTVLNSLIFIQHFRESGFNPAFSTFTYFPFFFFFLKFIVI